MFLSTKVLSKLMKDAYKTRLKVGYLNGGIMITSGEWAVWFDIDYVPNKIKALIVEFAGRLPEQGKMFSISKDYPEAQYEIVTEDIRNLFEAIENADNKLNVSPIVLKTWKDIRVLQTDSTKQIVEINDTFMDLVDKSEINLDIEGEPTGPCYGDNPYGPICWYNDICWLIVMPMKPRINPLFDALKEVALHEKVLTEG